MKLFIRVDQNGNAVDHPITEDNFRDAFPNIDPENLTSEFSKFVRIPKPQIGPYQVLVSKDPTYKKINGVFQDVWEVREMTNEEKAVAQQNAKCLFHSHPHPENWTAWTLDEATCTLKAPIPYPEERAKTLPFGVLFFWCGAENVWKESPAHPNDGKDYRFDYSAWQWVPV